MNMNNILIKVLRIALKQ